MRVTTASQFSVRATKFHPNLREGDMDTCEYRTAHGFCGLLQSARCIHGGDEENCETYRVMVEKYHLKDNRQKRAS